MSRAQLTSTVEQNTGGAVAPFVAGKNKIINGDFGVWQRGTSVNATGTGVAYFIADRWQAQRDGTGATVTISQQTFAPGNTIAGYEPTYFYRYAQSVAGTGATYTNVCVQNIEDVRTFAGQTLTISFWAKADASRTLTINFPQVYGSGGSANTYGNGGSINIGTSWQRYFYTTTLPSIAGKTIGTGSYLQIAIQTTANNTVQTIDIWGAQLEAGSVATPFTTATGTLSGELAACQRYYIRYGGGYDFPAGICLTTTTARMSFALPVPLRAAPSLDYSTIKVRDKTLTSIATTGTPSIPSGQPSSNYVDVDIAAAASSFTAYQMTYLVLDTGYVGFNAEL